MLRVVVVALTASVAIAVASESPARAQIVNVQGAIAKPPEKNGVTGQVELKLNWSEGNAPLFDLAGASSVVWKHDRYLGLAQVRGEYGASHGITLTKKTFAHVRERVTLDCVWRWEMFGQHEYDEFRRLATRALVGTGPALQIINTKDLSLLAGASYMLEYEKLDNRDGTTDAGLSFVDHRLSTYITGREPLASNVALIQTAYFQPRFDAPSNFRVLAEAGVETKLSSHLALTNSFVMDYDSRPPQGVKSYDTTLKIALVISF